MSDRELKFRSDGSFTIVQFTDLHWTDGGADDCGTRALMQSIVELEAPDLILFTGDVIQSREAADPMLAFMQAVAVAEDAGMPWAAVYGNHDAEVGVTREQLMELQRQSRYCMSRPGPLDIQGVGNYALEVRASRSRRTAAVLYGFDSGSKSRDHDWDGVDLTQIGWYMAQSAAFIAGNDGRPLPSLAFMHIPLPEYQELWNYTTCYGHNYEGVACSTLNAGLFAAFLKMNDVMGTLAGHNHVNDYWGELHGIRLCYGRSTGFGGYGLAGFQRGARVVRLQEDSETFETWIRLENGAKLTSQREHAPELTRSKAHEAFVPN